MLSTLVFHLLCYLLCCVLYKGDVSDRKQTLGNWPASPWTRCSQVWACKSVRQNTLQTQWFAKQSKERASSYLLRCFSLEDLENIRRSTEGHPVEEEITPRFEMDDLFGNLRPGARHSLSSVLQDVMTRCVGTEGIAGRQHVQHENVHLCFRSLRACATPGSLYYLHHSRSRASSAWGATRHNGSSAGRCINEGLRWLRTAMGAGNAAFMSVFAMTLAVFSAGVWTLRRMWQRMPQVVRGRQGGVDSVICSAIYVMMYWDTEGNTCTSVAALSALLLKALKIHAATQLQCRLCSVWITLLLCMNCNCHVQSILGTWAWLQPSFPPKTKTTIKDCERAAADAAKRVSREMGQPLHCVYRGQKEARKEEFIRDPEHWYRSAGKPNLTFEWSEQLSDGETQGRRESIVVRVDNVFDRGVPGPTVLPTLILCRQAQTKLQDDFAAGQSIFRNDWRGFARPNLPARSSKWLFCGKTNKWCEVIVCAEDKDFESTFSWTGSWCLVANKAKTDVDLNTAWLSMSFVSHRSLKNTASSKTSLCRFNPPWKQLYAELKMLGMWRQAYKSKDVSQIVELHKRFSSDPSAETMATVSQLDKVSVWLSQHVGIDDMVGFPVRIRLDHLFTRGVTITEPGYAIEMQRHIVRRVQTANTIADTAASSASGTISRGTFSTASLRYHCRFIGARVAPGKTDGADPSVQEAAMNSDALTWAAIALEAGTRVSHLHLCFQWSPLGGDSEESRAVCRWLRYDKLDLRSLAHHAQEYREQLLQDFLIACADTSLTGHFPIVFLGQLQTDNDWERCCEDRANEAEAHFCIDPSKWKLDDDSKWWSQELFWWEWQDVLSAKGKGLRVATDHRNLCTGRQPFPKCPRLPHVARNLHFTPQCFSKVGISVSGAHALPECEFLGILYDTGVEGWVMDVPKNGVDILDTPVYWKLPYGTVKCWSLETLLKKSEKDAAEFRERHTEDAYRHMAMQRGFHCLGKFSADQREAAKQANFDWRACCFQLPSDEKASCWWVTNPDAKQQEPLKLLNKSLALLDVETNTLRVATPAKLRTAVTTRQCHNRGIFLELRSNMHWNGIVQEQVSCMDGIVSSEQISKLRRWSQALYEEFHVEETLACQETTSEGMTCSEPPTSQESILRAHAVEVLQTKMGQLQATGKEDLWKELFQDTPRGAYETMWESLEFRLQRALDAEERQMERLRGLRAEIPRNADLESDGVSAATIDPDGFAQPLQRLPQGHIIATKHAEAVLLDRMYLALEVHYDAVCLEECRKHEEQEAGAKTDSVSKRRQRTQRRGMQYITQKRYEALEIPAEVALYHFIYPMIYLFIQMFIYI